MTHALAGILDDPEQIAFLRLLLRSSGSQTELPPSSPSRPGSVDVPSSESVRSTPGFAESTSLVGCTHTDHATTQDSLRQHIPPFSNMGSRFSSSSYHFVLAAPFATEKNWSSTASTSFLAFGHALEYDTLFLQRHLNDLRRGCASGIHCLFYAFQYFFWWRLLLHFAQAGCLSVYASPRGFIDVVAACLFTLCG